MKGQRWKKRVHRLSVRAERLFDRVGAYRHRPLRPGEAIQLIAYQGMAAEHEGGWKGQLRGRILRHRAPARQGRSARWNNLRASYARFDTRELSNHRVRGQVGKLQVQDTSDEEGYFCLDFSSGEAAPAQPLLPVSVSLDTRQKVRLDGDPSLLLPDPQARFGVISDIDDTLLLTQATSLRRMLRLTLFESPASRLALDGVAELYQQLHADRNPFFYVSSSPWNLYGFLREFMQLNGIVDGPLMLRDFGVDEHKFIAGEHLNHKLQQIRSVLDLYPRLPFILSGDSGQDDARIYARIADEYPGRILAIYIRDAGNQWQTPAMQDLISQLSDTGVDMLMIPDSMAAATHACARGWISEDGVQKVGSAVTAGRQAGEDGNERVR